MQKLLLLTSALLLAGLSLKQIHSAPRYNYTSSPMGINSARMRGTQTERGFRIGAGSYQTPDGIWHAAKYMTFNAIRLIIKDGGERVEFTAETLRQFEILKDTFIVFGNLPGQPLNAHPRFLESAFYRHGTRVLQWPSGSSMKPRFLLQRPQMPLMLVTSRKEDFKRTMMPIVAGCPALVASITDGRLGPEDVPVIMQQYDVCQFGAPAADKSK